MVCPHCSSKLLESADIPDVGKHVICYECNAEWVE